MLKFNLLSLESQLTEIAHSYNYHISYFRRNLGRTIQPCRVDHYTKLIHVPKSMLLTDLYGLAHEIGHIINFTTNQFPNTEEYAWQIARQICLDINIPLDYFETVKKASMEGCDIDLP